MITRTVHKYPLELEIGELQSVRVPLDAEFVSFGFQAEARKFVIWALVNPNEHETEQWAVRLVFTGMRVRTYEGERPVGSVQLRASEGAALDLGSSEIVVHALLDTRRN